jgi:hypothetical protein
VPATTITINHEQRDGLYELVRNHLGSVGDLFDALERENDFEKAEQLGLELAEDIRLMQDLGWGENDGREGIELTMPAHDLMEVLQRLRSEAGCSGPRRAADCGPGMSREIERLKDVDLRSIIECSPTMALWFTSA